VRWIEEFQAWGLVVKYRKGSVVTVPDALSRRPDYLRLYVMQGLAPQEEYVSYMEEYLKNGTLPKNEYDQMIELEAPHFVLTDGRLMRWISKGVITPEGAFTPGVSTPYLEWEFRGDLIQRMHNEYGHLSLHGMKDLVVRRGWWPKMDQDIRKFVESCANCQIAQRPRSTQEREYAQLPTPRTIQPFQRWGIDLIGRLPRSKDGNEYIITAIDYATGWPIAKAIKRATEDEIADFIFHEKYYHGD
jgi:Integrase zinc binding domain